METRKVKGEEDVTEAGIVSEQKQWISMKSVSQIFFIEHDFSTEERIEMDLKLRKLNLVEFSNCPPFYSSSHPVKTLEAELMNLYLDTGVYYKAFRLACSKNSEEPD